MSSGAGRGRGWLNLAKNAEAPKPMGLSRPQITSRPTTNNSPPPPPPIPDEYKELIDKIKEFNANDDGILFNKKVRYIDTYWEQTFTNTEEIERSFEEVYKSCLYDTELATKLVAFIVARKKACRESPLGSARSIHGCQLNSEFLTRLQRDVESSNQIQTQSPLKFRNIVHMLGEYYNRAILPNGDRYPMLARPLLSCLELLLNSKTLPDLVLMTTQLFLNGKYLKTMQLEKLNELSVKIRLVLVTESHLVEEAKLWLLLALDLCNAKFTVLPNEVYKFYEDHLGTTSVMNFQKTQDALSIQTLHTSKVLDSYKSNVNVLQISTSPTEMIESHKPQFNNTVENNVAQPQNSNFSNDSLTNKNTEKAAGRPILGAGARFIKKNEENGTWNNKKGGRTHKKKSPSTNSKKWEHDDRVETDYN